MRGDHLMHQSMLREVPDLDGRLPDVGSFAW